MPKLCYQQRIIVTYMINTTFQKALSNFQDVIFPSITVCNLNQIEASFLKELEEVNIFHPLKFFKTIA